MTTTACILKDNAKTFIKFIRYEGVGYVRTTCEYEKDIFHLSMSYEASELEGGPCKTIYLFECLDAIREKIYFIHFIEDYFDYKISKYYIFDNINMEIREMKGALNC